MISITNHINSKHNKLDLNGCVPMTTDLLWIGRITIGPMQLVHDMCRNYIKNEFKQG
jgi:hypothetical protein